MIGTTNKYQVKNGKFQILIETDEVPSNRTLEDLSLIGGASVSFDFLDQRIRTLPQNQLFHSLITDIAIWWGELPQKVKELQKYLYAETNNKEYPFSTSDMSVADMNQLITFVFNYILMNNIEISYAHYMQCKDLTQYTYVMTMNRKCVCTTYNRKRTVIELADGGIRTIIEDTPTCEAAQIHHWNGSTVGMGRNRRKIDHTGLWVMPLCAKHHEECHKIGASKFIDKYHVEPIELDEKLIQKIGMTSIKE